MAEDIAPQRSKIVPIVLAVIGVLVVGGGVFAYATKLRLGVPSTEALPKFITADVVDLSNYGGISKFRSGAGHSFAGGGEKCRSMKHYFMPKVTDTARITADPSRIPTTIVADTNLPAYSPTAGTITKIQSEQHPLGKQISIRPEGYEAYTIRLFHVYPLDGVSEGSQVTAGQRIGSLLPYQQTDVAIQLTTVKGPQYISYFDVMTDELFASYQGRGVANRNDFIITKEARDADPLTCNGEQFAQTGNNDADWTYFDDYTPPSAYNMEDNATGGTANSTSTPTHESSMDMGGQGSQSGTGGGDGSGGKKKDSQ